MLLLLSVTAPNAHAAFPLSDTLSPSSNAPVSWIGTATGPANTSPVQSCREGLDCDTFVLTFSGTTADWAGKTALIKINWQLLTTDYDLYILRELPSGQFVVAQSTNHPANSHATQELIDFSPAFYGTGKYLVRVVYTAATSQDQYQGSATTVAMDESSCRVPGLTVLSDQVGDAADAQANHDIERVSVAEPYLVGTSKLVFTIKASNLNQLTPNTSWRVYFRTPSGAGPRYFVEMRTDMNAAASFKYGTGNDTGLGDVDEGHYNPQTGIITITVAHNKVGFPRPNQTPAEELKQMYAQVLVGGVAADSVPGSNVDSSQAGYRVVGNSMCNPGKIAFISDIDGNSDVYVMEVDGSNPINMTNNPATEYSPSWSPDGRKITFASSRAGSHDIFVMDADGSNLSNLTNMPGSDLEPAWSPDGKLIAFDAWRDTGSGPGTAQIYLMNASGTNQVRLTQGSATYRGPSWSPDGKKLAFWGGTGQSEIFVIGVDGTDMTQLTSDTRTGNVVRYENIQSAWSPDGTRIAFSSNRDESYNIYVMNTDGSNVRKLTTGTGNNNSPAWSPDGLCITFSSDRNGNAELYAMNADGSNQTRLTNTASNENSPAWQPSGGLEPANLIATVTADMSVALTWLAPVRPVSYYHVERSQSINGPYTLLSPNPATNSFRDNTAISGTAYLYRVRAVYANGGYSNYSNTDIATTIIFTDDPLISIKDDSSGATVTEMKAIHITQLRQAVDAVRSLAGLPVVNWTGAVQFGSVISAGHVLKLRENLEPALGALKLRVSPYSENLVPGVITIKKAHIAELRERVK
jgi:Tol biopolymer transport system component